MTKILLALLAIFILFGTYATLDFRGKMGAARLGTDVTYTLDSQGDATVEMANKSYFTTPETEKNFDAMVARVGRPESEAYRKGVEDSLRNISDKTGRLFTVSDFEAKFERQPDHGAQVYRFRWSGFAERRGAVWVVDFKVASSMKLNKDSSLTVILPAGTSTVKVEPAPTGGDESSRLVWTGTGEIAWPYIEYK